MDSSPVLRNQSQNKIHRDFQRTKNEHNKMQPNSKPFKLHSAPNLLSQDGENKDPANSEMSRKTSVHPGVSKLPVLAKSLHLQTPSSFKQSHCRWEEKPLAGKAKKKKPCTRPVPFNLSQPKSSRTANENPQPLNASHSQSGTHAVQPVNNVNSANLKNTKAKPSKHPAVVSSNRGSAKGTLKSHGKATEKTIHATEQISTTLSNPLSSNTNNAVHQNSASSGQPALSAEACFTNTDSASLKGPAKPSHASQNLQLTTEGNFSKGSVEKGVNFQSDHASLLSILRNEGVTAAGLGSATPQSKPYNYLPQRVSVMKSRQKAGQTTGPVKSVQFSPDTAALQSILRNEGVKIPATMGVTPRNSVCPPGRGTSIYAAQRVPVRKHCAELAGGQVAVAVKHTPLSKWTPQRVQDTRHQPISAMKWHLSTQQPQQSPYPCTPSLRSYKANFQQNQEEIVQRLFDDQEEEQKVTHKDPETQAEQPSDQASATTTYCEENVETSKADSSEDEEKENEQEQSTGGGQPFFQAPQRDTVIFFSTSKKLFRAPRFEKQESSPLQEQHGPVSSEPRKVQPVHEEVSSVAEPACQIKPSVQSLPRDLILHKGCVLNPAVALLRKRLPPLEDLRMDEEVATYTSVCVPAAPAFHPPRPRCGNPLATIMHFEESTTFIPIGFDLSSDPSSPHSSTLQE